MLGLTLAQYCKSDSAMAQEQKRIEAEIAAFEKGMWGVKAPQQADSLAQTTKNSRGVKAPPRQPPCNSGTRTQEREGCTQQSGQRIATHVGKKRETLTVIFTRIWRVNPRSKCALCLI